MAHCNKKCRKVIPTFVDFSFISDTGCPGLAGCGVCSANKIDIFKTFKTNRIAVMVCVQKFAQKACWLVNCLRLDIYRKRKFVYLSYQKFYDDYSSFKRKCRFMFYFQVLLLWWARNICQMGLEFAEAKNVKTKRQSAKDPATQRHHFRMKINLDLFFTLFNICRKTH